MCYLNLYLWWIVPLKCRLAERFWVVKHCRTKRHIKIKSFEKVSVTGRMYISCFGREGESKSGVWINISLKMCCIWGKALGCGSLKETFKMWAIFVKYCARCAMNYFKMQNRLHREVTSEILFNSGVWTLQVSLQTGTCRIHCMP